MCNSTTTPQLSPQQIELIDQLDQGICALRGFIELLDSADLREIKSGDLYALGLPILLQFQQAKQNIKGTQHA